MFRLCFCTLIALYLLCTVDATAARKAFDTSQFDAQQAEKLLQQWRRSGDKRDISTLVAILRALPFSRLIKDENPFAIGAQHDNHELLEWLLLAGYGSYLSNDSHIHLTEQQSPIVYAAARGHIEMVIWLIEHGQPLTFTLENPHSFSCTNYPSTVKLTDLLFTQAKVSPQNPHRQRKLSFPQDLHPALAHLYSGTIIPATETIEQQFITAIDEVTTILLTAHVDTLTQAQRGLALRVSVGQQRNERVAWLLSSPTPIAGGDVCKALENAVYAGNLKIIKKLIAYLQKHFGVSHRVEVDNALAGALRTATATKQFELLPTLFAVSASASSAIEHLGHLLTLYDVHNDPEYHIMLANLEHYQHTAIPTVLVPSEQSEVMSRIIGHTQDPQESHVSTPQTEPATMGEAHTLARDDFARITPRFTFTALPRAVTHSQEHLAMVDQMQSELLGERMTRFATNRFPLIAAFTLWLENIDNILLRPIWASGIRAVNLAQEEREEQASRKALILLILSLLTDPYNDRNQVIYELLIDIDPLAIKVLMFLPGPLSQDYYGNILRQIELIHPILNALHEDKPLTRESLSTLPVTPTHRMVDAVVYQFNERIRREANERIAYLLRTQPANSTTPAQQILTDRLEFDHASM